MARPPADIDEKELIELASQGAKNAELAHYFGVDEQTIANRFSKILLKTRSIRRMRLRQTQTKNALGGDNTMLIWLGKNELGQIDKVEQSGATEVIFRVCYEDGPDNRDQNPEATSGPEGYPPENESI